MKIVFVADLPNCWESGIWWHRIQIPTKALMKRGHGIKQIAMGQIIPQDIIDWADVFIFGRAYPADYEPIKWMREIKSQGKRVIYDMDDDYWEVTKDNPSVNVSNALKDQYEGMIEEADAIITPSPILAKKFKKHFKKEIFICPNGFDPDVYQERPHENKKLIIGYMGAASHWKDLNLIAEVIDELSKKHDFYFVIYGLVGDSLEAAMYTYRKKRDSNLTPEKNAYYDAALEFYSKLKNVRMLHVPFMPPELHPIVLSRNDFDIGLAPLEDTVFNSGKSNVKFYEYASVGTVTVASNVHPYKSEVNYLAKNNFKDWYKKIERLIVDEEFRNKIMKEQQDWVKENRSTTAIGVDWELACQKPGGLEVANQRR